MAGWWAHVLPVVEVGTGGADPGGPIGVWDTARWDQAGARWGGAEPVWRDVRCDVRAVALELGRRRPGDRFGPATCTVRVDNREGRFLAGSSPPGDLALRVGRDIRVRVLDLTTGVWWPLFRGTLDSIAHTVDPTSGDAEASLIGRDGLALFAAIDPVEQTPVGAGERSDQRIGRIADVAAWPALRRELEVGTVTVQATNLARQLADELGITADSEGGAVYVDQDGDLRFRQRDWLATDPRSTTPQLTVATQANPGEFCPSDVGFDWSGDTVRNDLAYARAGGVAQHFTDEGSIALYRRRTYRRLDLICESDAQVATLARRQLAVFAPSTLRFTDLQLVPEAQADPTAAWPKLLGARVGDRWAVRFVAPEGWGLAGAVHVQGLSWALDRTGRAALTARVWDTRGNDPTAGWSQPTARWDQVAWA